jgi:arylsulfatase A-like enzyme
MYFMLLAARLVVLPVQINQLKEWIPMDPSRITRRDFFRTAGHTTAGLAVGAYASSSLARPQEQQKDRPNLIIIFADDLGYGDLSCFGSNMIKTPYLDQMAQEGVRLTQFYAVAAVCTPSRCGLLTGRYPVRVGLPRVLFPTDTIGLPDDEITIAEALKTRGYRTACVGKWHLGHLPQYRPHRHGFDRYLGLLYSNDMQNPDLYRNDDIVSAPANMNTLTDTYTKEAIDFIQSAQDEPFFLYLPHTMPHIPLGVSDELRGKSDGGIYGDVVESLDLSTGRILKTLRDLGIDKNTFVFFTSDNGPWYEGSPGPFRDRKASIYEGGIREPAIAWWPGVLDAGRTCDEVACTMDLFTTCLGLAGAEIPTDRPIDGKNIMPLLKGEATSPHEALYFYINNDLHAVRAGKWKYVLKQNKHKDTTDELYNMLRDPTERYNLYERYPEVVKQFQERITAWTAAVKPRELEAKE